MSDIVGDLKQQLNDRPGMESIYFLLGVIGALEAGYKGLRSTVSDEDRAGIVAQVSLASTATPSPHHPEISDGYRWAIRNVL